MNKVVLIGRLTKDPVVTRTANDTMVGRYTLAVDRRKGESDFISCTTFNRGAEFAERYLHKGTKIAVVGRIQTGSYKNRDGNTVYTTDVVVEEHEFVERRSDAQESPETHFDNAENNNYQVRENSGFMSIPEGIDDAGLPFN